jgi:hypothetical protein
MKNKNAFTYTAVVAVIFIALLALYQSTNAPDTDTTPEQETKQEDMTNEDETSPEETESYIGMSVVNAAELAEEK